MALLIGYLVGFVVTYSLTLALLWDDLLHKRLDSNQLGGLTLAYAIFWPGILVIGATAMVLGGFIISAKWLISLPVRLIQYLQRKSDN